MKELTVNELKIFEQITEHIEKTLSEKGEKYQYGFEDIQNFLKEVVHTKEGLVFAPQFIVNENGEAIKAECLTNISELDNNFEKPSIPLYEYKKVILSDLINTLCDSDEKIFKPAKIHLEKLIKLLSNNQIKENIAKGFFKETVKNVYENYNKITNDISNTNLNLFNLKTQSNLKSISPNLKFTLNVGSISIKHISDSLNELENEITDVKSFFRKHSQIEILELLNNALGGKTFDKIETDIINKIDIDKNGKIYFKEELTQEEEEKYNKIQNTTDFKSIHLCFKELNKQNDSGVKILIDDFVSLKYNMNLIANLSNEKLYKGNFYTKIDQDTVIKMDLLENLFSCKEKSDYKRFFSYYGKIIKSKLDIDVKEINIDNINNLKEVKDMFAKELNESVLHFTQGVFLSLYKIKGEEIENFSNTLNQINDEILNDPNNLFEGIVDNKLFFSKIQEKFVNSDFYSTNNLSNKENQKENFEITIEYIEHTEIKDLISNSLKSLSKNYDSNLNLLLQGYLYSKNIDKNNFNNFLSELEDKKVIINNNTPNVDTTMDYIFKQSIERLKDLEKYLNDNNIQILNDKGEKLNTLLEAEILKKEKLEAEKLEKLKKEKLETNKTKYSAPS